MSSFHAIYIRKSEDNDINELKQKYNMHKINENSKFIGIVVDDDEPYISE